MHDDNASILLFTRLFLFRFVQLISVCCFCGDHNFCIRFVGSLVNVQSSSLSLFFVFKLGNRLQFMQISFFFFSFSKTICKLWHSVSWCFGACGVSYHLTAAISSSEHVFNFFRANLYGFFSSSFSFFKIFLSAMAMAIKFWPLFDSLLLFCR